MVSEADAVSDRKGRSPYSYPPQLSLPEGQSETAELKAHQRVMVRPDQTFHCDKNAFLFCKYLLWQPAEALKATTEKRWPSDL